jgi:polar amino acid transport system permease protein
VTTTAKLRLTWFDTAILGALALAVAYVAYRAGTVLNYRWNWAVVPTYLVKFDAASGSWGANLLLQGLFATIRLAIWGTIFAAMIGVAMGLCRVSQNLFLRLISRTYVELIRNVPPLVFIFIVYFFLANQVTPLLGVDAFVRHASPETLALLDFLCGNPRLLPAFVSALMCLALFEGAYITEIVRAGIQAIDKGQWEASASLGLARLPTLRLVILPQAIQRVVPPLAGQFISLVKDSSIVSLISIQEMTYLGNEVAASTSRVFEVWITISAMYFVVCFGLSLAFSRLERHMQRAIR